MLGVVALVLLGGGALGAYVVAKKRAERDVRGSATVEFVPTEAPEPPRPRERGVEWPTYGYSNDRRRVAPGRHRPPFRMLWRFGARKLVEFPPVIAYGRWFLANNAGGLYGVGAKNGVRASSA